jgi:hypothetical protein
MFQACCDGGFDLEIVATYGTISAAGAREGALGTDGHGKFSGDREL